MARFPIDESKLPGLGQALAKAVSDPSARAALKNDPKGYLVNAGVDENALSGLSFNVVEDTDTMLNLVIPASLNDNKVNANDPDYMVGLGRCVTLLCGL